MKISINSHEPVSGLNFIDTKVLVEVEDGKLNYKLDVESLLYDVGIDLGYKFNGLFDYVSNIDGSTPLYYLDISDLSAACNTDAIASIIIRDGVAVVQYPSFCLGFYTQFKYDCGGIMNDQIAQEIKLYIQSINIKNVYNRNMLVAMSGDLDPYLYQNKLTFNFQYKDIRFRNDDENGDVTFELGEHVSYEMIREFLDQNLIAATEEENWQQMIKDVETKLMMLGYIDKFNTESRRSRNLLLRNVA